MAKRKSAKSLKILFVGNSFTARNHLPAMIATLAAASGWTIEHQLISAGGASLRRHWNAGDALAAIKSGRFDFVVLQEQSTLPIKNATRMHESVRLFDEAIRAAGARTVLYMTWARAHAPQSQQAITDAYKKIADELHAILIPAGCAWEVMLGAKGIVLHDKDGSHPLATGSYLVACAFVGVLCSIDALDAAPPIDGVDDAHAKAIKKAVARTVAKAAR